MKGLPDIKRKVGRTVCSAMPIKMQAGCLTLRRRGLGRMIFQAEQRTYRHGSYVNRPCLVKYFMLWDPWVDRASGDGAEEQAERD